MKNWLKTALFAGLLATSSDLALAKNANLEKNFENLNDSQICKIVQDKTKKRVNDVVLWPETGKNKIILCLDGKPVFSSQIATGKRHSDGWVYTPEWNFNIWILDKNKKSNSYKTSSWVKAPMPYATQVFKWVYIHEWKVFDKSKKVLEYPSHGCVRLPKGKAKEHFELIQEFKQKFGEVGVIVEWTNPNTNWRTFFSK